MKDLINVVSYFSIPNIQKAKIWYNWKEYRKWNRKFGIWFSLMVQRRSCWRMAWSEGSSHEHTSSDHVVNISLPPQSSRELLQLCCSWSPWNHQTITKFNNTHQNKYLWQNKHWIWTMKNETIIKQKHETIPDFRIGGYVPHKLHTADPDSYTNCSEEWVYLFARNKNQFNVQKVHQFNQLYEMQFMNIQET